MSELVSILVPAYNAERWIGEALSSAVTQTWPNKEIIVVDDGSTDGTLAAARRFASPFVKVVTQDNRGASAARNHAYALAQGQYIQWLDADDVLAPDKIARQMASAHSHGALALHCSPYGVFHYRIRKAKFTPTSLWRDHTPISWTLASFTTRAWMIPAAWLVSRTLAQKAGTWDERLSLNDDGEYFCRVVLASQQVSFVALAACYYRSTGYSQLSRDTSERALESLQLSLTLCIQHLLAVEISERTRGASLSLLQMYSSSWQEREALRTRSERLAAELGGRLQGGSGDRSALLLERAVGIPRASRWMHAMRRVRLEAKVRWDEALFRLGG